MEPEPRKRYPNAEFIECLYEEEDSTWYKAGDVLRFRAADGSFIEANPEDVEIVNGE